MPNIIIGIILLVVGIGATIASPHSIFIGAIVGGAISLIKGIAQATGPKYDEY